MATDIPELDAYGRAAVETERVRVEAERLATIVANGAKMLAQDPATWRFVEPAPAWDSRNDDGISLDDPPLAISPTNWPDLHRLLDVQRRYQSAVTAEHAAFNALPPALRSRLSVQVKRR